MSQNSAAARVPARPVARSAARDRVAPPRLRVVAPVPRRSASGLALLSVALLVVGLLVLLLLNINLGKGAYELTALQRDQRLLSETQQELTEHVETVSAPQKLAAAAEKLGMVPAPNPVFVRLPDGTLEGRPAIATARPKPPATAQAESSPEDDTRAGTETESRAESSVPRASTEPTP